MTRLANFEVTFELKENCSWTEAESSTPTVRQERPRHVRQFQHGLY
jgi:hypothetical protein